MIVVTGGAGFIGSNLVAALEARRAGDLVVADRLGRDDKWRNIAKRDLYALVAPERLLAYLAEHTRDVEVVFHLGAISATTETDAGLIHDVNVGLSTDVWNWCVAHGVRFIYASSAATYGDGSQGFDDDGSVAALAKLRPLNPYGWSKHLFDRQLARSLAAGRPRPPQWAGLKFFNVYGPNEGHKGPQASVAWHLYPKLAAGEPASLFRSYRDGIPDGGQQRDFIWIDDCVDVMLWLLDHPKVSGLFNVGTGKARTFDHLAQAMFAALGQRPRITYVDMPETLRPKYQYFTQATVTRLRDAGYRRAFTTLEDGIAAYVHGSLAASDPYR